MYGIMQTLHRQGEVMRKLLCWLRAIPFYIRSGGMWCPHLEEEIERHSAIVIAGEGYFRESKTLQHRSNEKVYQNATVMTTKCVRCGFERVGWFNGNEEDIPTI